MIVKLIKMILKVILSLVILLGGSLAVLINYETVFSHRKISAVDEYARDLSGLDIPDNVSIIALGEATHGNREFQSLKLDTLKQLVETEGVRCFVLETDFAEGMMINDYIQTGEGTAREAVEKLAFSIYHTEQMAELVSWMKEYNDSHEDKLRFYGFDMQNPHEDYVASMADSPLKDRALKNLDYASEYYEIGFDDFVVSNNFRDQCCYENICWIQDYEAGLGNARIFICGHNGHVSKKGLTYHCLGESLSETYQDAYYVIGTDFYKTLCNINGPDGRKNHRVCSADVLAYQAKRLGGTYLLDFTDAKKGDGVYEYITGNSNTGSLGESWVWFMKLVPTSYRIKTPPVKMYDAMYFVYDAHPLDLLK